MKILLVEDELMLAQIVKDSLETRGFAVEWAPDGELGWLAFQKNRPDVVVLDIMMPRLDGFSLLEKIRKIDPKTPVIFLTARSQTADVVKGFELGGNDYLKKPFSMDELIVRIRALVGRTQPTASPPPDRDESVQIGSFLFFVVKQILERDGSLPIVLSHRESEVLRRLVFSRNAVVERRPLLLELWGDDSFFNGRSLDVFITKLRRHLRNDPAVQILNVRGVGYKLVC